MSFNSFVQSQTGYSDSVHTGVPAMYVDETLDYREVLGR